MNILEPIARRSAIQPDEPAFISGAKTVTYQQLMSLVGRLAAALRDEGVGRGDVVALIAPSLLQHMALTLAVAHRGAVSVPVAPDAFEAGKVQSLKDCRVSLAISAVRGFELPPAGAPRLISLESLKPKASQEPPPMAQVEPHDIWRICFSSGTTGAAKAIQYDHQSLILRSHLMSSVVPGEPKDRLLIQLSAGLMFATSHWLRALACGEAVVGWKPGPAAVHETLRACGVTRLVTSTGNAIALAQAAQRADSQFADPPETLRSVIVSGSSAPPSLQELLRRHLCADLAVSYGASEMGMVAYCDPALLRRDPECVGRVLPWMEVQAVDASGNVLPPGERGLLRMRSPTMAAGYVAAPEGEQAFRDGWFYSKDVGSVSADGLMHLGGREGEVLNIGGRKIDPARIEAVVCEDPAVTECAALAVPGKHGQPSLVVVVVATGGLDRQALMQRCKEKLGGPLVPKAIILSDKLPRNAGGKVLRDQLARQIASRRAAAGKTPADRE